MQKRSRIACAVVMGALMAASSVAVAGTTAYKYDPLGRVLLSTYPDGSQDGFSYDSAGNRSATRRAVIVPPTASDRLAAGQGLIPGASITSPSGCFKLTLQDDGNAVITDQGAAIWSSSSSGAPSANIVMQSDGNMVVYGPVGEVFWAAGSGGHPGGGFVQMQNDGNLVIYQGSTVLWSSSTARTC